MDGFAWLKIRKMYLNIYIKVSDYYHWDIWRLPSSRHQPSQAVWQKKSGCYWWKTVDCLSTYSKAYRWHYKKAMLPKVTVHKAKFKKGLESLFNFQVHTWSWRAMIKHIINIYIIFITMCLKNEWMLVYLSKKNIIYSWPCHVRGIAKIQLERIIYKSFVFSML